MLFEYTLWKGLVRRLCLHGMPPFFAMHVASACWPGGARKESRKSGFQFATPIVSQSRAYELVDFFFAIPRAHVGPEHILRLLVFLYGQQCVEGWFDEEVKASEEAKRRREEARRKEQHAEQEKAYQSALNTLGVTASSTQEQVNQRYRMLCRQYHPDRHHDKSDSVVAAAAKKTKEINAAYEIVMLRLEQRKTFNAPQQAPVDRPRKGEPRETTATASNAGAEQKQTAEPTATSDSLTRVMNLGAVALFVALGLLPPVVAFMDRLAKLTIAVRPEVVQGPPPLSPREPAGGQAGNDAHSTTSTTKHEPEGEQPAVVVNAPVTWPNSPPHLPRPTPSMSATLSRTITKAREDMANAKYDSAYRRLRPLFAVTKPDAVHDMQLWISFLDAHSEALNGIGSKSTFEYLEALHDNGIAWHELMKQAMAAENASTARDACRRAEECYRRVARSSVTSSRLDREHMSLVGRAMENIAVLKLHFADYTRDIALYRQARGQIEECWGYLARHFGASSGEYQSSVAEWNKQDAAGKSRGGP